MAQGFRLVEANPHGGHVVGVVAREPGVLGLVGGTGLACQVGAVQSQRPAAGAALDHVLQHAGENIGGTPVDDALGNRWWLRCRRGLAGGRRCLAGHAGGADRLLGGGQAGLVFSTLGYASRVGGEQRFATAALDTVDQVGGNLVATVGKGAPACSDFHRRQGGGTQGQRQVARQVLLVEAELGDVVDGAVHAHGLQQADRNQVARLVQRFAHADRAEERVGIVLRSPHLIDRFVDEYDRRVVDQAGGGIATVQCSTVDERLEA